MTYCDDIQDAEEAVDTVPCINLFHHTFLAILEQEKTPQWSVHRTRRDKRIMKEWKTDGLHRGRGDSPLQ